MQSTPSVGAQIIVTIIPIVGIVMGCVVVFFYLLWSYKYKKLLIQHNQYRRSEFDLDTFCLLTGIVLFGIGTALSVFFLLKDGISYGLLGGVIPFSVGASLILFFIIRRKLGNTGNGSSSG